MEAHKQDWIVSYLDHLSGQRLHSNTSGIWVGGVRGAQEVFPKSSVKKDHLEVTEKSENIFFGLEVFHWH